ncbi:SDR family NAD(P)-dependent oxidoreductase [Pseudomonas sp. RGM 3321]|uniref:SDR family NAD(P)-dependent oxidoreductase n=1 Tax=Pseudomonas sp. RGM 3321 TaxID=2930089 RepID=UPI001FCAAE43|nr:SDR family NAD(P)-dependent oxidoreductase [Pseudomonas sp. RGM 3321]MCJ2374437.1 SDR family oxidoreductase [Pseudomonas sp. RGM 3321]
MKRFQGKTAIVTGAGSGIGRATALAFARQGARVIATDINAAALEKLAAEADGLVEIVPGDITRQETVDAVVASASPHVEILANIAGIMDGFLPLGEVDDGTWDKVIAVNLTAIMRLSRATIPLMLAAGGGAIVNISSEAGLRGSAAGAAYTAAKHGVIGLTKSAAFMYGPQGIRVNAIAPGPVTTGMHEPMRSGLAGERIGALMPVILPPSASAESLASNVLWLASEQAENINGIVLPSDGGWSAA